jgi:hypothetical protein
MIKGKYWAEPHSLNMRLQEVIASSQYLHQLDCLSVSVSETWSSRNMAHTSLYECMKDLTRIQFDYRVSLYRLMNSR